MDRSIGVAQIVALLAVVGGGILCVLPPPDGLPEDTFRALGPIIIAISLWSTNTLPLHVTAMLYFILALFVTGAPPEVVFSSFAVSATWLIFAGMLLTAGVVGTGLDKRIAEAVDRLLGGGYAQSVVILSVFSTLIAFPVPSGFARTLLVTPIAVAIADRMGLPPGSRARDGLTLGVVFSTNVPTMAIMTANAPSVVLSALAESVGGVTISYTTWLVTLFPVCGVLMTAAVIVVILLRYPGQARAERKVVDSAPWKPDELRLAAYLAVMLALWMTDRIHGVAPAWVGLGVATVAMLPRIGVLPRDVLTRIDTSTWFFAAGIISLGAVAANTGVSTVLADLVLGTMDFHPGADASNYLKAVLMNSAAILAVSGSGAGALMVPLAEDIATATGWPLETALMLPTASFFFVWLPYALAPIATGIVIARAHYGRAVVTGIWLSLIFLTIITPINFFWWRLIGRFAE